MASDMPVSAAQRRADARRTLDAAPNVVQDGRDVRFAQSFATLAADETLAETPRDVLDACRALLDATLSTTVARTVRDTVTFTIGASLIPLFALEPSLFRPFFQWFCLFNSPLVFFTGLFKI